MNLAEAIVFVVDDDPSVRRAVQRLLHTVGLAVETFATAWEFLRREPPMGPACLVLDVHMPEVNGLTLQELLAGAEHLMPIVFLTGYGTVPRSVQAMKAGASDFLQKPCDDEVLLEAIYRALHRAQRAWHNHVEHHTLHERLETLTPREREVFACVVTGMLNKQIADALGMSEKTVKVHRGRLMQKMHALSLVELVRMADKVGIRPPCHTT
jgi:RNA polymerase sigma factor (sigma-70 family)